MKDERRPAVGYVRISTDQQQNSSALAAPGHRGPRQPTGHPHHPLVRGLRPDRH